MSGEEPEWGGGQPSTDPSAAVQVPKAPTHVFISYASQDAAVAQRLCAALEVAGLACWIAPRDVRAGESYAAAIVHAINSCRVLVLVLSKSAIESSHVLREVERASSKKRPVLSVRMDTTELPPDLEYFLSANQWLDASGGPVEQILPSLVESVRDHDSGKSSREVLGGSAAAARPGAGPAPSPAPNKSPFRRRTRVIATALAVSAVGLAFILTNKLWVSKHVAVELTRTGARNVVSDKSIAVLPFLDLSEKKDQEYFATGIAEEVLDRLAKVPGLKVIGRTSSFQFKGKNTDPASIGAALGVAYILQGSVHKDAGRVRVAAQLVEGRMGLQRWSDHFDSDVVDVLHVQDTIAVKIARALQITVEVGTASRSSVKSPEALDAYLRGLQSYDRGSQESVEASVANFQQALTLDPTFAPAAIGLGRAYLYIGEDGWLPTRVAFERAREAALLAQRLDPKSPSPHVQMAMIHIVYDWDWAGADRELQQAFALGPRDIDGLEAAASLAAARGHWDEARQLATEAIALDPLNADTHGTLGFLVYLRSGRLTEAEESLRRALQSAPGYGSGHYWLGVVLMLQGHDETALAEFGKETPGDGRLVGSAMAYFATGRKAESDAQLAAAIRENETDWPSGIARVYAFRGEKDRAFEWLNRAYELRDEDLYFMKSDPLLKNLENDPRYKALLRKMNLSE
jgi:TolB-like protein/Tfp pilus assembly protein PilF